MFETVLSMLLSSAPSITLAFFIYTYLLYVIFFKDGKFGLIEDIEELGKFLLLFLGLMMLIVPIITGIVFLGYILFAIPIPNTPFLDWFSMIFTILVFTFYPYLMKRDAREKKKKFDLGDWLSFILFINLLLVIFTGIYFVYTAIFVSLSRGMYPLGLFIFLVLLFLLDWAYLRIVLTKIFHLRKDPLSLKRTIKMIIICIVISMLFLIFYLLRSLL